MSPSARVSRALIRAYQRTLSPRLGANCRFQPTCSAYAYEAIGRFGTWRGSRLAIRRLGRCHPFSPAGFDPVPADWPRGNR